MGNNLVIVESPAKAKTIKKYLGKDFEVLASYGHVRDLVPKEGAVDPKRHFAMKYQVVERNQKHVDAIARALKKAKALYLATDPDREGEAISWHLHELLKAQGALKGKEVQRVVFYEITKNAVREAMEQPRGLSLDLVNAQQARRALDFLVGFNLSPLLWKKVRPSLSAGRVQSPALRMICEREDEIAAFKPQEYWTIDAELEHSEQKFPAKLVEYQGGKVEQFSFTDESAARAAVSTLTGAARGRLTVLSVDRKQRRRNPAPPFTTSTLQQEASRKLGFSAQKTMRVAQQLYEGVDIGEGAVGLITYMRTDSLNLAQEAVAQIREVIVKLYGPEALAEEVRVYRTKSANAQEAHEAIRPTDLSIVPADIEKRIEADQFRLYSLIWKRTMACQMAPAVYDTVAVELLAGSDGAKRTVLRANGSTLVKPGYISVYQEGTDDAVQDDSDHVLPPMAEGDRVKLLEVIPSQHFTEPPPRFTEASLVKALEEYGIGRPSTYASIISTLRDREYVEIESRRFTATDIGKIVSRFLTLYFTIYVDYDFTAKMENALDAVANGEQEWVPLLERFWKPFIKLVKHTETSVSREEVAMARDLGTDPQSGKPMTVRMGRFGPFVQIGTKDDEEKPRFAGLTARTEDGYDHARGSAVPVPVAAQAREHARRRGDHGQHGPLRTLREIRREIRVAQDRRPLHRHAGARARGDSREADRRRQPPDLGFSRRRHPGAQRPLRTVRHGPAAQRQDSEGPRPEEPHARGMPDPIGRGAGAHFRPLGPKERPRKERQGRNGQGREGQEAGRRGRCDGGAAGEGARKRRRDARQRCPGRRITRGKARGQGLQSGRQEARAGGAAHAPAIPSRRKTAGAQAKKGLTHG